MPTKTKKRPVRKAKTVAKRKAPAKRKPRKRQQRGDGYVGDAWNWTKNNKGKIATGLLLGRIGLAGGYLNGAYNRRAESWPHNLPPPEPSYVPYGSSGMMMPSDFLNSGDTFFDYQ